MDITDYACGECRQYIRYRRHPYRWYVQHARDCVVLHRAIARGELSIDGGKPDTITRPV